MEPRLISSVIVFSLILTLVRIIHSEDLGKDYAVNDLYRQEAFEKIEKILGIRGKIDEDKLIESPPQFMAELYDAVTDKDGAVIASNPYNARIVRSIREIGAQLDSSTPPHFYYFNVSHLNPNEYIIEAELHLYLKNSRSSLGHLWPFYDIRVYQVLPDGSLNEPEAHKLLSIHHADARASSGWHILKVKRAVLSWLRKNEPNLGLLLTAQSIDGHPIKLDSARHGSEVANDKQPLMVLFNDDEHRNRVQIPPSDSVVRHKRHQQLEHTSSIRRRAAYARRREGQPEMVDDSMTAWHRDKPIFFSRQKKPRKMRQRNRDGGYSDDLAAYHDSHDFVSRRKSVDQSLTSMSIYQRAMTREKMRTNGNKKSSTADEIGSRGTRSRRSSTMIRPARRDTTSAREEEESSSSSSSLDCGSGSSSNDEPCAKRDLWVDFYGIGLTSIIAPLGYEARRCAGHCRSPLSQDQKPTNHATIQSVVHKMNLIPEQRVDLPSCVPVHLAGISILYQDDETGQVTLKNYDDMIVVSCGCR
ncbi:bone morphogenetic protein 2-like [Trichogramma pretiosum]|uniref:bone morphogenetic protein 2-like n=1 Tax=Trichogramma pretiosum TaxID=7493 RepID=UPI0006C9E433|nr:bone morphogenetic protein 2-like [Trichogramma pretiosum]